MTAMWDLHWSESSLDGMLDRICLEVLPDAVSRSTSTESCLPVAEAGLLKDDRDALSRETYHRPRHRGLEARSDSHSGWVWPQGYNVDSALEDGIVNHVRSTPM